MLLSLPLALAGGRYVYLSLKECYLGENIESLKAE